MAKEDAPAFQLYIKEWRSSRSVQRMTMQQRGMYLEMLLEQWESLYLPDDPRAVYELVGGPDPVEAWIAAWPVLRRKFCDRRGRPRTREDLVTDYANPDTWDARKMIVNVKLEEVRRERKRYKKTSKVGGAARSKGAKRNSDGTYQKDAQPAGAPATPPAAEPGVSSTPTPSATASATPSPSASAETRSHSLMPSLVGKQRPLPHYRRIRVFPWMVDDLLGMLGDHAEVFDLDRWLLELDASGCVLPAQIWPWLKDSVGSEAARRGLMAPIGPALGKSNTRLATALANIRAQEAV
jgi:hypothetical protein